MIMYLGNTIYMGIPINCCCCWQILSCHHLCTFRCACLPVKLPVTSSVMSSGIYDCVIVYQNRERRCYCFNHLQGHFSRVKKTNIKWEKAVTLCVASKKSRHDTRQKRGSGSRSWAAAVVCTRTERGGASNTDVRDVARFLIRVPILRPFFTSLPSRRKYILIQARPGSDRSVQSRVSLASLHYVERLCNC